MKDKAEIDKFETSPKRQYMSFLSVMSVLVPFK